MTNEELYKLVREGKSLAQMVEIAYKRGYDKASNEYIGCGMANK